MEFASLKAIHIGTAAVSYVLFFVRAAGWVAAQIVFGYIVAAAFSHHPLPYCRAC